MLIYIIMISRKKQVTRKNKVARKRSLKTKNIMKSISDRKHARIQPELKERPISFQLEFEEPKDVYNVRRKFIEHELKYIKDNELEDYTEEIFNKDLKKFLMRLVQACIGRMIMTL